MKRYPLARNGIFLTVQGEGSLLGVPMTFVRLAGCSIGCPLCDTDYAVAERLDGREIALRVADQMPRGVEWIWITGGEPTDHELTPLVEELRRLGAWIKIALATAGHRTVPARHATGGVDWISVSPHSPTEWVQKTGQELKLVPGLNRYRLADFAVALAGPLAFGHRYVQPCDGRPETIRECVEFVKAHPEWRLGCQGHKQWAIA